MNYYQHNIGDYAAATAHLTLLEHGVYRRMLDLYYSSEIPLPAEAEALFRKVGARTPEERTAVQDVARDFFEVVDGCLRQKRCDAEIERFHEKSEKAKNSGKQGGRRKMFDGDVPRGTKANAKRMLSERLPDAKQKVGEPEPNAKPSPTESLANQEPITSNQEKESKALVPDDVGNDGGGDDDTGQSLVPDCPHEAIIAAYHEILPELRQVAVWNEQRAGYLRSRWREAADRQTLAWWREYFGYVRECPLLMGKIESGGGRKWQADLEWLVRPTNFVKVIEGKYEKEHAA